MESSFSYTEDELKKLAIPQLKAICKEKQIVGYSKLPKPGIIDKILSHSMSTVAPSPDQNQLTSDSDTEQSSVSSEPPVSVIPSSLPLVPDAKLTPNEVRIVSLPSGAGHKRPESEPSPDSHSVPPPSKKPRTIQTPPRIISTSSTGHFESHNSIPLSVSSPRSLATPSDDFKLLAPAEVVQRSEASTSTIELPLSAQAQRRKSSTSGRASTVHIGKLFTPSLPLPVTPTAQSVQSMLVDGKLGPTMDISAFCTVHELSLDIASRLTKNGFQNTKAFRYVTLNDLKEMLFKHGEIASLRVAVSEWSEGSQQ